MSKPPDILAVAWGWPPMPDEAATPTDRPLGATNMATTAPTRTTITRRNRNLGYQWTNAPTNHDNGAGSTYLAVDAPIEAPRCNLTVRQLVAQRDEAQRRNAGNYWAESFWIDGRRILLAGEFGTVLDGLRWLADGDVDSTEITTR